MQDVEDYRDAELDRLEKLQSESLNVLTLKHFGDIVSSAYKIDDIKRLATISEAEIKSSLDRVDESIVGRQQRNDWLKAITAARSSKEPTERDQIGTSQESCPLGVLELCTFKQLTSICALGSS